MIEATRMIQRFSATRSSIVLPMLVALSAVLLSAPFVQSFSTPSSNACNYRIYTDSKVSLSMDLSSTSNLMSSDSSNLDRFRSVCLVGTVSKEAVDEFDPDLYSSLDNSESDDMWVAIYRSNNNKPSIVVRDDFFRAMNDATSGKNDDDSNSESDNNNDDDSASNAVSTVSGAASFLSDTMPSLLEIPSTKPVAIARLIKSETSTDTKTVHLLDNLRCSLKKENQDESCDGGSEFVEALSVAVDTLLLKHLQRLLQHREGGSTDDGKAADVVFEGTVRTKATLFSGKLFEQRGFTEVEILSKDMATHVSNYEACFSKYADRTIEATMSAGTRDRALQIVALLGRLDPEVQNKEAEASGDDDNYDPWANMQLYRS